MLIKLKVNFMEDIIIDDLFIGDENYCPYIGDDCNEVAREQYHKWLNDDVIEEGKDDGYHI